VVVVVHLHQVVVVVHLHQVAEVRLNLFIKKKKLNFKKF
jgi:hypothetical protein